MFAQSRVVRPIGLSWPKVSPGQTIAPCIISDIRIQTYIHTYMYIQRTDIDISAEVASHLKFRIKWGGGGMFMEIMEL